MTSANKFGQIEQTKAISKFSTQLIWSAVIIFSIACIGCFILVWTKLIEFRDATQFILAIFSGVMGLLGLAAGYYFSSK
ncbi:MAG: hypothetical protein AABX82_09400 [Nanoarchaeota archaeon]